MTAPPFTRKAILRQRRFSKRSASARRISQRATSHRFATMRKSGMPALAEKLGIGVPTLSDVIDELMKPGRDPRDELPPPLLRSDVLEMKDLKPGMEIVGTVRNVIDFGAFVDIGVHQDGLVHISQISKNFIKHPSDVLKTGDIVKVWVISVDEAKKRIALTMIEPKRKTNKTQSGRENPLPLLSIHRDGYFRRFSAKAYRYCSVFRKIVLQTCLIFRKNGNLKAFADVDRAVA